MILYFLYHAIQSEINPLQQFISLKLRQSQILNILEIRMEMDRRLNSNEITIRTKEIHMNHNLKPNHKDNEEEGFLIGIDYVQQQKIQMKEGYGVIVGDNTEVLHQQVLLHQETKCLPVLLLINGMLMTFLDFLMNIDQLLINMKISVAIFGSVVQFHGIVQNFVLTISSFSCVYDSSLICI